VKQAVDAPAKFTDDIKVDPEEPAGPVGPGLPVGPATLLGEPAGPVGPGGPATAAVVIVVESLNVSVDPENEIDILTPD
jgi:hypothetical protein